MYKVISANTIDSVNFNRNDLSIINAMLGIMGDGFSLTFQTSELKKNLNQTITNDDLILFLNQFKNIHNNFKYNLNQLYKFESQLLVESFFKDTDDNEVKTLKQTQKKLLNNIQYKFFPNLKYSDNSLHTRFSNDYLSLKREGFQFKFLLINIKKYLETVFPGDYQNTEKLCLP